jgi:Fes/CIP4 homology domain.
MSKRSASTLKAKTPSDMATYNVSPGNFWDVGNFSRCSKRIIDSNNLCDDLIKMYTERAEIEAKYSRKLTDWHERWTKHLDSSSAVYATMKTAHLGTLKEGNERAIIHMDCWGKIHNQVVEFIKREKESKYHKAFVGIKESKELDEEFTKAQKPWATAYGKVQRAKKNFHSACKQRDAANMNLEQANKEGEVPMEKVYI